MRSGSVTGKKRAERKLHDLRHVFQPKKKIPTWRETLEEWIGKLEAGDLSSLRIVYSAFAEKDPKLMRRASEAIRHQLAPMTDQQLLALCERFRTFTSLEWSIDWSVIQPDDIKNTIQRGAYRYVLILGSFHPNGYFREKCVCAMEDVRDMLFWLFPRINDWVWQVRTTAGRILEDRLADCGGEELIAALPAYERLKNCRRRTEDQMLRLEDLLYARLLQVLRELDPDTILCMEPAVRTSLYRTAAQAGIWSLAEMEYYLEHEKLSCLKRILIWRILAHPDCTPEWAEHYLTDRSAQIRRMAVEYRYEHLKDCWPGLETMLLDKSRGVREYAVYILERRSSFDIRGYYLVHLYDASPETAILGLAEYSSQGNVPLLLKHLHSPQRRTLKCTLLALGYQEDFTDEELLWNYLLDDRVEISKAAYLSIKRRSFYPGAQRIYHAILNTGTGHQRRYLLNLLLRENSWQRLPCLLRLYRRDLPGQEEHQILSGICCRCMYGSISRTLHDEILLALSEKETELPECISQGILHDMKFLIKPQDFI